jgi:hypothetical protein
MALQLVRLKRRKASETVNLEGCMQETSFPPAHIDRQENRKILLQGGMN